jgi:hypothetical protein
MPPVSSSNKNADDGCKNFPGSPKKMVRRCTNDYLFHVSPNGGVPLDVREKRKRVRFAQYPETGKILCTYHDNMRSADDAIDELAKRWYSQLDFRLIKRIAMREASALNNEGDQCPSKSHFMRIYEACTTAEGLRSIRTADAAALSDTSFRGLESVLFNHSKNRKAVIEKVLVTQEDFRMEILNGDATAGDLPALLGSTSRAMSQHARRLARVLGSGDAIAAGG